MIEIPSTLVRKIEAHAQEAFPEEGCGFLIGFSGKPRRVLEMRRARNIASEDRRRRYRVDPLELLHADDDARKQGLDLIGIYHSHPNHPAVPSEFDRSHAASWYTYVILGIDDREPRDLTAWRFDDAAERFKPEGLRVTPGRVADKGPPRGTRRRAKSPGKPQV
jgi:proteasome lid subunit RPN8/RPN11